MDSRGEVLVTYPQATLRLKEYRKEKSKQVLCSWGIAPDNSGSKTRLNSLGKGRQEPRAKLVPRAALAQAAAAAAPEPLPPGPEVWGRAAKPGASPKGSTLGQVQATFLPFRQCLRQLGLTQQQRARDKSSPQPRQPWDRLPPAQLPHRHTPALPCCSPETRKVNSP